MPSIRVTWSELAGRQLQTATGAPFKVVRVTATHVSVRPVSGRRDYALSIPRELEPAVAVFADARNFPIPADLRLLGVRPVLTSYAWGILKAVLLDRIGVRTVKRAAIKDFVGGWVITDMPDMGAGDWQSEPGEPVIRLQAPPGGQGLWGEYEIGLSSGSVDGDLREFGGEAVLVFGYEGVDEMDPNSGGGWLQLIGADTLEGEFMSGLGRFSARREPAKTMSAGALGRKNARTTRRR